MVCPNCGKNISDDSKVCTECGAQLGQSAAAPQAEVQTASAEPRKSKKGIVAIVLCAVVVLGAAVGALAKNDIFFAISPEGYIYDLVTNTFEDVELYGDEMVTPLYGFDPTKDDYTMLMDYELGEVTLDGETVDFGGLGMTARAVMSYTDKLFKMDFDYKYGDDVAETFGYTHSDDKIGLSLFGGEYITLSAKDILKDWNESILAQEIGSPMLPEDIDLSFSQLYDSDFSLELPEDIKKQVKAASADFIAACEIGDRENVEIALGDNKVTAKKIVVNIEPAELGSYLNTLVDVFATDEEITELVKNLYSFAATFEAAGDSEYYDDLMHEFYEEYPYAVEEFKRSITGVFSEVPDELDFSVELYEYESKLAGITIVQRSDNEGKVELSVMSNLNGITVSASHNGLEMFFATFSFDTEITDDRLEAKLVMLSEAAGYEILNYTYDIVYDFAEEKINMDLVMTADGEKMEYNIDGTCSNKDGILIEINKISMSMPYDGEMIMDCNMSVKYTEGADYTVFDEKEELVFKDMSPFDFMIYFGAGYAQFEEFMNAYSEDIASQLYGDSYYDYYYNDSYDDYFYDDEVAWEEYDSEFFEDFYGENYGGAYDSYFEDNYEF